MYEFIEHVVVLSAFSFLISFTILELAHLVADAICWVLKRIMPKKDDKSENEE